MNHKKLYYSIRGSVGNYAGYVLVITDAKYYDEHMHVDVTNSDENKNILSIMDKLACDTLYQSCYTMEKPIEKITNMFGMSGYEMERKDSLKISFIKSFLNREPEPKKYKKYEQAIADAYFERMFNSKLEGVRLEKTAEPINVHVYLDTSGSYTFDRPSTFKALKDAIEMPIELAKLYGIKLYFNSFTHELSSDIEIDLSKDIDSILTDIDEAGLLYGGTELIQIFNYINESDERKSEFSIVITDFEIYIKSEDEFDYPENLYMIAHKNLYESYKSSEIQENIMKFIRQQLIERGINDNKVIL